MAKKPSHREQLITFGEKLQTITKEAKKGGLRDEQISEFLRTQANSFLPSDVLATNCKECGRG